MDNSSSIFSNPIVSHAHSPTHKLHPNRQMDSPPIMSATEKMQEFDRLAENSRRSCDSLLSSKSRSWFTGCLRFRYFYLTMFNFWNDVYSRNGRVVLHQRPSATTHLSSQTRTSLTPALKEDHSFHPSVQFRDSFIDTAREFDKYTKLATLSPQKCYVIHLRDNNPG